MSMKLLASRSVIYIYIYGWSSPTKPNEGCANDSDSICKQIKKLTCGAVLTMDIKASAAIGDGSMVH